MPPALQEDYGVACNKGAKIVNGAVRKGGEAFSAGRLTKLMSPLLQEWNEQPRLQAEIRNLSTVLRVDRAHVVMLSEQGIITKSQGAALIQELENIARAGTDGFKVAPGYGSIVLQVEQELIRRLGENIAGRLPIARSRLDQGPTVNRMVHRDAILAVMGGLQALQATLIHKAELHRNTSMIHYTHLQQAQPANFGHWLLAFQDRLQDCCYRLQGAYRQTDRSPLGAVGLCGTDLPTSRHRTAELLGFSSILENSRLGRDGYDQIVIIFELAMIMTVLNDLCTDLHVFSSNEFRTVESDDSHCQTSSVFPHKKNPYGLETIKINAASAHGWVATALASFRNEGTSDQSSRSVACAMEAYRVTLGMLRLTAEIVERLVVHEKRWEELLSQAWVTTNRLGNVLLTRHGMSYRTAHGVVARLVKNAMDNGVKRADITTSMLYSAANEMGVASISMTQAELTGALDHAEFIRTSRSLGGVGPDQVERMLEKAKVQNSQNTNWIDDMKDALNKANIMLEAAARALKAEVHTNGTNGVH